MTHRPAQTFGRAIWPHPGALLGLGYGGEIAKGQGPQTRVCLAATPKGKIWKPGYPPAEGTLGHQCLHMGRRGHWPAAGMRRCSQACRWACLWASRERLRLLGTREGLGERGHLSYTLPDSWQGACVTLRNIMQPSPYIKPRVGAAGVERVRSAPRGSASSNTGLRVCTDASSRAWGPGDHPRSAAVACTHRAPARGSSPRGRRPPSDWPGGLLTPTQALL